MNDAQGAKQQIVEKIKGSSNILVTVSRDSSVDELSAALGLTIMLNNMNKHATAVVSGDIPPAIEFLEPGKTFENTVDSLRDFIIALDKEKADHLRYKVDGDVVKIFITPYRTTISDEDLDFSQGDYNVELVLALGVRDKDHLDKALESHGRIFHDATVATFSCGDEQSTLGSVDWYESGASSISEMLVSLSEALKTDKPVLDEQISTALLTGIVAATDRFSNNKTSSKVMTMAAQLMAAGANQQLIAAKLEEAHEITDKSGKSDDDSDDSDDNSDGSTNLSEGKSSKVNRSKKSGKKKDVEKPKKDETADDGSLAISHEKEGDLDSVAKQTAEENQTNATESAEANLAKQLETVAPAQSSAAPSVEDLQKDLAAASADVETASEQDPSAGELNASAQSSPAPSAEPQEPQSNFGGTLNATTEQAEKDKREAEKSTRNNTILSHDAGEYIGDQKPTYEAPINAFNATPSEPNVPNVYDQPVSTEAGLGSDSIPQQPNATLAELDKQNRSEHEAAQADVAAALSTSGSPAPNSQVSGSLPPLPSQDFSAPSMPQTAQPQPTTDAAGLPPLPDFSTLPQPPAAPSFDQPNSQLPPEQLGQIFEPVPPAPNADANQAPQAPAPQAPSPTDPNQFKIPGQS